MTKQQKNTKAVAQKANKTVTKTKKAIKELGKKGGNAQFIGATTGAVVGATVGGVAGAILSDKKTRRDVGQKITEFTKTAVDTAEKLSEKAVDVTDTARERANQLATQTRELEKKTSK